MRDDDPAEYVPPPPWPTDPQRSYAWRVRALARARQERERGPQPAFRGHLRVVPDPPHEQPGIAQP